MSGSIPAAVGAAGAILAWLTVVACSGKGHAPAAEPGVPPPIESGALAATATLAGRSLGPPPLVVPSVTPVARSKAASVGPPLKRSDATAEFPMFDGKGMSVTPKVYSGGSLVLLAHPEGPAVEISPEEVSLWNPLTGESRLLWKGIPGRQDEVFEADGDWLITVRFGLSLPFAEWELIVRNLGGEARTIARSDPRVARAPGLHPDLPFGFAPRPSIANGTVVWEEHFIAADGRVGKRINAYQIDTGETRTLVHVPDATREDLRSPSIGGGRVVWIHKAFAPVEGDPSEFDVAILDLRSDTVSVLPISGRPWQIGLTVDGASLAWDDGMDHKYAMNLLTGDVTRYAGNPYRSGWGVMRDGSRFSWVPGSPPEALAGYFDSATGIVREVEQAPEGSIVNVGEPMGPWFVLQDMRQGEEERVTASRYLLIPLGP